MERVAAASVPVHRIGATGGETIAIPGERAIAIKTLADRFEGWLPAYMSGAA
jgi:phosphoribosylformylglycinamidine synthase